MTGDRWYVFLIVYHTPFVEPSGCVRCAGVLRLAAMTRPQFVCRLGALLALVATTAVAQTNVTDWNTVKALTTGTEVRITAGSRTVSGKIDRITDDTLVVTSGKGPEMFTQQEVTRVSVGKQGHRGRNTLIGLGIGTGAGLGVGAAVDAQPCKGFCIFPNAGKVVFTPLGAIVGTLVGVAIPTGGWREIYKK